MGKVNFAEAFDEYFKRLRKIARDEKTEHTDRTGAELLLEVFATQAGSDVKLQHEPKKIADKGAPDFKITVSGSIIGYVETKAIGENLAKVLKSDQIKRYRTLSENILLTDYLQWIWISKDSTQTETLCHESDLENPKFKLRDDRVAAVAALLEGFFSTPPVGIGRAQQLALALATRSRLLRDYLGDELIRQHDQHQDGKLYGLFLTFRDQIFHELTLKEFADAFAQMLAYGLFLARLNSGTSKITLNNAREFVPGSFRLIRELVEFLSELTRDEYAEIRWVVEEVVSIVNGLDLAAIHEDLSFRQRKAINRKVRAQDEEEHRLFERDPFIYFYEDYLKAYDKDMRKGRGVYYTPPPIVNFIVRAVDGVLKDSFGIEDGLADHKRVTVLDFACGTGTFLLEVFQRIFDNIGGADAGKADKVVREHILKNIYGFEYLIAPYTIAHLKLSQYLKDRGHPLADDERLQVFLTNTLEPIEPQKQFFLPAITEEVEAAQAVKDMPILVITGNPPYSGHSKNKGPWISAAIDGYKYTIETDNRGQEVKKPLGERNPKWLNDDYVKFIRFAQMKMDGGTYEYVDEKGNRQSLTLQGVEKGIVGIITNHSWLDNPTFRGMRQSLMRSFQQIYVLDLHGNAKKKERAPDGSKDENVFDIEQGVAISLFVKRPGLKRGVWRGDFWGTRLGKYRAALSAQVSKQQYSQLSPTEPFFNFVIDDATLRTEYEKETWPIPKIFRVNVLGFQTHRDDFAIAFDKTEIKQRISDLLNERITDEVLRDRYQLTDNRDWKLSEARSALDHLEHPYRKIISCDYRPFDVRACYFGNEAMDYPRRELTDHIAGRSNFSLGVGRAGNAVPDRPWELAWVSELPIDANIFRRGGISVSPLYLFQQKEKVESFTDAFRTFLDAHYDHHYMPEEVLGYIYAVLHAPTYRVRYAEFLRHDFPRVPFPDTNGDFEKLSKLGWALVEAHLLRAVPPGKLARYHGKGDHVVEAVRYSEAEQAIWINKSQCFKPVPKTVWNFHIGGYQVLEKYLKSRKSRTLSLDEIDHLTAVAGSLAFTIQQMEKIDKAYKKAFPAGG